jgi:DASS family divalent anion:Na+ symporter
MAAIDIIKTGETPNAVSRIVGQWRLLLCVLVPIIILLMPVPEGLTPQAWQLFALYVGAILGFILRPLPEPAVLLCVIAISSITMGNTATVLSGFAHPVVWLVFSAFMIGTAIFETGLGRRIAYWLIGRVGGSTLSLGYVAAITDLAIAPATPSNTARTGGIVFPIIRSIAASLGSIPGPTSGRVGTYLTVLLYSVSLTTGYIFLTAISTNVLTLTFAKSILKTDIDWLLWFKAAALPGFICLALLPLVVYFLSPPELKSYDNKEVSREGLAELGPISGREMLLGLLFLMAILAWATGSWTKIEATPVAVAFVAACLLTGVVSWESLSANRSAWSTFVWYGGIVGIADSLAKAKFFEWLTKILADTLPLTGYNVIVTLALLVLFCIVLHYVFASLAVFVTAMMPVLFSLALAAQLPLYPTIFLVAFATNYGAAVTHYGGALGPVLFGAGYVSQRTWWTMGAILAAMSFVIHMVIGLPYWKWLGLW